MMAQPALEKSPSATYRPLPDDAAYFSGPTISIQSPNKRNSSIISMPRSNSNRSNLSITIPDQDAANLQFGPSTSPGPIPSPLPQPRDHEHRLHQHHPSHLQQQADWLSPTAAKADSSVDGSTSGSEHLPYSNSNTFESSLNGFSGSSSGDYASTGPSTPASSVPSHGEGGKVASGLTSFPEVHQPPAVAKSDEGLQVSSSATTAFQPPSASANSNSVPQTPPVPTYEARDESFEAAWKATIESGRHEWIRLMDFGRLASQHHMSPYSMLKFGGRGSPYAYVPLSLQQPELVHETMVAQQRNEANALTWLNRHQRKVLGAPLPHEALGLPLSVAQHQVISTTGKRTPSERSSSPFSPATAAAHPSKERKAGGPNGVVRQNGGGQVEQDLQQAMTDEIFLASADGNSQEKARDSSVHVVPGPLPVDVAVAQEMEDGAHRLEPPGPVTSTPGQSAAPSVAPPVGALPNGAPPMKTSDTHPINISPMIPVESIPEVSRRIFQDMDHRLKLQLARPLCSVMPVATSERRQQHVYSQQSSERLIRLAPSIDLTELSRPIPGQINIPMVQLQPQLVPDGSDPISWRPNGPPQVGNLLLSSCPGKKVRLTGPVRGRGAICRDLKVDLKRIRQIGVGLLICCLDDEELALLGAPWVEYERTAAELGMDVIRLPVAEGFAPTSIEAIDLVITSVVMEYTLRGVSTLVHCRGGVGRAGLIACTWMLKMGLVRAPLSVLRLRSHGSSNSDREQDDANLTEEINVTAERLVETIRRRRSPKAIETAEQVAFIVDYIYYLRRQELTALAVAEAL